MPHSFRQFKTKEIGIILGLSLLIFLLIRTCFSGESYTEVKGTVYRLLQGDTVGLKGAEVMLIVFDQQQGDTLYTRSTRTNINGLFHLYPHADPSLSGDIRKKLKGKKQARIIVYDEHYGSEGENFTLDFRSDRTYSFAFNMDKTSGVDKVNMQAEIDQLLREAEQIQQALKAKMREAEHTEDRNLALYRQIVATNSQIVRELLDQKALFAKGKISAEVMSMYVKNSRDALHTQYKRSYRPDFEALLPRFKELSRQILHQLNQTQDAQRKIVLKGLLELVNDEINYIEYDLNHLDEKNLKDVQDALENRKGDYEELNARFLSTIT